MGIVISIQPRSVCNSQAERGTSIANSERVDKHRSMIDCSFETAKNDFDLEHPAARSELGWRSHVLIIMLAFAMIATIRHHTNVELPPKAVRKARYSSAGHLRKWGGLQVGSLRGDLQKLFYSHYGEVSIRSAQLSDLQKCQRNDIHSCTTS